MSLPEMIVSPESETTVDGLDPGQGIQAALDFADAGYEVVLVEKGPSIGDMNALLGKPNIQYTTNHVILGDLPGYHSPPAPKNLPTSDVQIRSFK
jgi:heterodisulfide reductase subunit A-like polyferredoxin